MRGRRHQLEHSYLPPIPPTPPANSPPTPVEVAVINAYDKDLKTYKSGQAVIKQAIASTIPDALFLRFKDAKRAAERGFTSRAPGQVLHRDWGRTNPPREAPDLRVDLIGMGSDPGDENSTAIILGSLPLSYYPYLSAITATSTLLGQTLKPDDLIHGLNEEADRRRALKQKS